MSGKYYLTTPLYYVNSRPHIGHSYTEIAADVLARWNRLCGRDVYFLTGTDEHGQKIERAAREAGLEPQAFTDKISGTFVELWKTLNVEYTDFIRTTEPRHKKTVEAVWLELQKRGDVYKSSYSGWYCTPDETFWTEGQIVREEGKVLCPDCKRPVEKIEEENYFLRLSKYQSWLTETIRDGKEIRILPDTRKNEVLGFLEHNDLQDLCISRPKNRLAWGIPSPLSADHVTYVWFDALINYISAVGYGSDPAKLKKWWPADMHLIGKDILRHHAIYWTILLKALDLPLPKTIFAHGWWVQGGEKMSKSRGNAVDPTEVVNTYGVDAYRYFLLRETPFGQDGTFSEEALILRTNTDLANDLGNLLHRTLSMCEKYFAGRVPDFPKDPGATPVEKDALALMLAGDELIDAIDGLLADAAFSEALAAIWAVVTRANKFIESSAPWALSKEKREKELGLVILSLAEVLRDVAQAVWPFMPGTAQSMWTQLGLTFPIDKLEKTPAKSHTMLGHQVAKGAPLFPRILTDEEKAKLAQQPPKPKK